MNAIALIDRLEAFGGVLPGVVACVTPEDARWKPPSGAWSILEVVCHLVDEELRDFRLRVFQTLREPSKPWPLNDPEAWARDGRYNEQDLAAKVAAFVAARAESVRELRLITSGRPVDWTLAYQHPKVGPVPVGDLLCSWAAHDALHLRQIVKRMYELAGRDAPGFSTDYAGPWGA